MPRKKRELGPLEVRRIGDLTDDHVRYFAQDPHRLDLISGRADVSTGKYILVLLGAVLLVGGSKLLAETYGDEWSQLANNVIVDLVFEMGAALIGSVATVLFIGLREKRHFEQDLRLRFEIERRIEALEGKSS